MPDVKTEHKILALSLILGLFIIVVDSALNALIFDRGSFWQLLLTVPRHENYNSAILLACFLVFGLIAAHLVTERNRELDSLVANEERLATTLHSIGDAVIATDPAGAVIFLNPTAQRLTGWPADEARGQPITAVFQISEDPDGLPVSLSVSEALAEEGAGPPTHQVVLVARDDSRLVVEYSMAPIKGRDDIVTGAIFVFHDATEHRQVEEALRREKETAQRYLDIADVILTAVDRHGRITMINQKGGQILGLDADDVTGRNLFDNFIPERLRHDVKMVFGKLMAGELEHVEYFENLITTAAGEERLIAWHNTLLKDEHGTISGVLSSGEDITERLAATRALQESDEQFRSLFTAAEDLIFVKDLELKYTMINPSMEKLLGLPVAEQLGRTEEEVFGITGGGRELLHEVDNRVLAGEKVEEEVTRPIKGEPLTLHIIKMPMRDTSGAVFGLCGIARNITHRKRSADALRQSEVRLQRQNAALAKLDIRKILARGDLPAAVRRINETAAEALDVERVSVWLYNAESTAICCLDLYENSRQHHSDGIELARDQYPAYFAALEENLTIAAHDAHSDPRTREFADSYLTPLRITSMMNAPIRAGGQIAGVLCCEQVGPRHPWTLDEQNFAASMADLVALALEASDRGRAVRELRESEERYSDLIERANDGIGVVQDSRLKFVNPRMAKMVGYSVEQMVGTPFIDYVHPDDLEITRRRYQRRMAGEDVPAIYQLGLKHHDGRKIEVEVNAGVINYDGQPADFVFVRGLTDRQQTEDELRLAQFTFDRIADAAFWMGPDARFIYVNEAACRALGYTREELLSMSVHDIDPDFPPEVWPDHWRELQQKGAMTIRSRHRTKDGRIFPVEIKINYLKHQGHEYNCALARHVSVDDEARETGEADRQGEEQYRTIIENTFDLIIAYTFDGNILYASPQAAYYGFQPSEVLGRRLTELIHPDDRERSMTNLRQTIKTGNEFLTEYRLVGKDGTVYQVEEIGKVVRDGNKIIQITGVVRDITDRKRAEEIINQRDELIKNTIESLDHPFYVIDAEDYTIKLANSAADFDLSGERSTCYAQKYNRATPCDTAECPCPLAVVRRTGQPTVVEHTLKDKDGKQRIYEVHGHPIFDREGRICQMIGYSLDITDRKRAEAALRNSEEKYRTLYSSMNEGVALHEIIYDDDGAVIDYLFLDVNPAYETILGLEQEKVIARKATEVYRTNEAPFLDIYARVVTSGTPVTFDEYVESQKKTFRVSVFSLGPGRFATIFEDITQHKRFEDQIRVLARLPEENPNPVLRVDADGLLIYANEQSRQLLHNWQTEVGRKIPEKWKRITAAALEFKKHDEIEFESDAATYLMFIRPVVEAGYVNMYALDITDHRRTEKALLESEEQLRQAQKMEAIGRLAGGVAHDFNNLISVIAGHAELLLHRLGPDDPLSRNVGEIKQTADRASGLTRQLLAFSRKQVLEPKVLNINAVVVGVETMLQRLIGEHIELTTATDPGLGPVTADPGQIEQVLMNLVVNARDALPEGGRITIETANVDIDRVSAKELGLSPGSYVRLIVSDTGMGMNEKTKARLFEPFFTTKEAGKGTGLGLAMVYGIITQSGGYIKVDSELSRGTTFTIYLPHADIPVDAAAVGDAGEAPSRRDEIILVVEDEEGVRDMVCKTLRSLGYEVIAANDGVEALEKYEQLTGTVSLLLTDVVMPQMSGIDLAEKLIAQRPDLKVIFMSGYTNSDVVKESPVGKGSSFLEKPFALDHLCHTVRAVLDQPAPQLQQTP
ncbi:PAS domain S-box protein [Candidatus Zixiibacteriota bacterium]